MSDQWTRFQLNLGVWQGSFITFDQQLQLQHVQPSELTLSLAPSGSSIELALLFWPKQDSVSIASQSGDPVKRIGQHFSSLQPELCFFPTGSFCRGSLFIAPVPQVWSRPFAEFGFLFQDRRHRLVLLWDGSGRLDRIVLIREFRAGCNVEERPAFEPEMLSGEWLLEETNRISGHGEDHSNVIRRGMTVEAEDLDGLIALPDGGAIRAPKTLGDQKGVDIEAWWCAGSDRIERIVRRYDLHGSWVGADHQLWTRA